MRCLVTGGGGFIGWHLTKYLVGLGFEVRAVDIKFPVFEPSHAQEFMRLDLTDMKSCLLAAEGMQWIFHLSAQMGGIGFITRFRADVCSDNVLMDLQMLQAAHYHKAEKFFYSSSACVYPQYRQGSSNIEPLKETDAFPADPEPGYGFEKLFAEKMCEYFLQDYGLETRVARYHNSFGPLGTYDGGREKAPAALCRKIALAKDGDGIEVWGDGKATRSFMYVDDCVEGTYRIMQSSCASPLNLGSSRLVTIDGLVGMIANIAKKEIRIRHNPSKPEGVRGRNSDNTKIKSILGWEPMIALEEGLQRTYRWIEEQLRKVGRI